MSYATIEDIRSRYDGTASDAMIESLLDESALIVDAYNQDADIEKKKAVTIRMVIRACGNGSDIPVGATQGTMSALGYSQTWTLSSQGTAGELYLSKMEKKLLGCGNKIGTYSPVEDLAYGGHDCNAHK